MILRRFFLILILAGGYLFFSQSAMAITVGPSLLEIEAEPGEGFVQEIKLFNETSKTLTLYPVLENIKPKKENSQPQYLGNKDALGAARWIKPPIEKVTLKQGELKKIILSIRVPKMLVAPGGHYAALFWTDQPPQNAGIGAVSRVGTIFLFKIKGQLKEELKLLSFEKEKDAACPPATPVLAWRAGPPACEARGADVFNLRVENSGNTHLRPVGQLVIFNWRRKVVKTVLVNPLGQLVLPQSQRDFKISVGEPGLGKYSARAEIYYGSGQKIVSPSVGFWSAPERMGLYLFEFIILVLLVWTAFKIVKKRVRQKTAI